MNNIEKVREVMRELTEISKGERISSAAYLATLSEKLRAAMPIAPRDARPGEFYRVRVLDNPNDEFVGTRPANGVVGAIDNGEKIMWDWSLINDDGLQSVADDDEIKLTTGRKLV